MLETGTKAPDFELLDENSKPTTLAQFASSFVVLYFYPKDDTAGCTAEACAIRDSYGEFAKAGIVVLGVSKDTPESHRAFKDKYGLPFTLLSDPEEKIIEAYGAKGFPLSKRITYIINPEGVIVKTYPNVDPAGHAAQILADIKILK